MDQRNVRQVLCQLAGTPTERAADKRKAENNETSGLTQFCSTLPEGKEGKGAGRGWPGQIEAGEEGLHFRKTKKGG